jgi:biopolymer transport protein ExbD
MAFNMTSAGGRRSRGLPAMAEINVTPFVDVVLVLLIIFIITAHVMDYGVEIQVPKTKAVASTAQDHTVVVALSDNAELFLNGTPIKLVDLVAAIHNRFPGQTDVYFRGSGKVTYETAMNVAAELGNAKFNVKLVTQPDDNHARR